MRMGLLAILCCVATLAAAWKTRKINFVFKVLYGTHLLLQRLQHITFLYAPYPSQRLNILVRELGPASQIQITQILHTCSFNFCWTLWCWNKKHAAAVIKCHVYFHQYVEYSLATNQKQKKIFLIAVSNS